jgi:hypothetical protein
MSGVQARVSAKSLVYSLEGTVVWEYDLMAFPQTIVQLYRGLMKVYVNQSGVYEGATAVVEHRDKDQAAGLEMAESFILCSHQAFKTHIKRISVFIHEDYQMEVAQGRFANKEGEVDLTQLESEMFFLQVKASMSMKGKLRQVRSTICVNWREIAHMRLEAIAGADNPNSLITIFGRAPCHKSRGCPVRHEVCASGGGTPLTQELHGRDTCHAEWNRSICGSHKLCERRMGPGIRSPGTIVTRQPARDAFLSSVLSGKPSDLLLVSPADGVGQAPADSDSLPESGYNREIQRVWSVGFDGLLGHIIPAGCLPLQQD